MSQVNAQMIPRHGSRLSHLLMVERLVGENITLFLQAAATIRDFVFCPNYALDKWILSRWIRLDQLGERASSVTLSLNCSRVGVVLSGTQPSSVFVVMDDR
jgi:hypothetical protein